MKHCHLFSNLSSPTLLGLPTIPLIFSVLLFLGCKEAPKGQAPGELDEESSEQVEVHGMAETAWIDEISLDQGAKWAANVETTEGVSQMLALIESSNAETVSDHIKLGDGLNEIKNMIVRE